MLLRIDPTRDEPVFVQLASSIRADAAAGRMRPGDRLPAAREVAAALGVNLHTVLHAYQQLRDEGLIDMRRGRGAVITDAASPLAALRAQVEALVLRAERDGVPREALVAMVRDIST
ncbi:GntR family transcriptional regulator [Microbacterium paludicola]|uniref:GntR family transcriptional regulator n=1 Tax=Microbacterium paludicola TaxID=300019 RepID=A0A4Y9FY98_9MICO|nr:GntR family transcriptional regulator [Microbacterium paludicola]MBF0815785.1 GntR family transcriptional regulator [Microbacterium paludicola]TFU33615.1 GntR family transcriptional regulator [Microbacterium paludicola]